MSRPRRIPRSLARAPIWIFRLGAGGVFGGRLIMVEHRGRTTGRIRQVVLETVARQGQVHDVVSGYGWSAQWLRNVEADPRVRLWAGWGRGTSARARILPADEARDVLERYRTDHPVAAQALGRALGLEPLRTGEPLPPEVADALPVVRITPRAGGGDKSAVGAGRG